ncbi:MAG: tetratricopeptide repeat protein [Candidatus Eiseniibacteriota bacterium]
MTGEGALGLLVVLAAAAALVWSLVGGKRRKKTKRPPYIAALGALVDGDEETAIAELKNAVREDSSNVDAYLRLGDLFRRRNDAERAYQLHRELASRPGLDRSDMARVQLALARDHFALGRPQRAMDAARESVKLAEDRTDALQELLSIQERTGDTAGAFQTKKELAKRAERKGDPSELAAYRARQGEALAEEGNLKEAERVLREARRLDSGRREVRRVWGGLRERLGDYAGAIAAWEELLDEEKDPDASLFADLERVRFLDGSFSEMEDTYNRFLDRVAGHEAASFGLARFLQRKGQVDAALEACRRGLRDNADSPALRTLCLALLLRAGRFGEAESIVNEWLTENLREGRPEPRHGALEPQP